MKDVFLSYATEDEEWVDTELIPRFINADIHYFSRKYFELGKPKIDEISRAVQGCKWTLLIISPAYLQDHWNQYESILALSYGVDAQEWRVIPVVLNAAKLPKRLDCLVSINFSPGGKNSWAQLIHTIKSPVIKAGDGKTIIDRLNSIFLDAPEKTRTKRARICILQK